MKVRPWWNPLFPTRPQPCLHRVSLADDSHKKSLYVLYFWFLFSLVISAHISHIHTHTQVPISPSHHCKSHLLTCCKAPCIMSSEFLSLSVCVPTISKSKALIGFVWWFVMKGYTSWKEKKKHHHHPFHLIVCVCVRRDFISFVKIFGIQIQSHRSNYSHTSGILFLIFMICLHSAETCINIVVRVIQTLLLLSAAFAFSLYLNTFN